MRETSLICVCGKSGVGKTAIVRESGLRAVTSYTTRPMRDGEVDGVDYHFRSKEWMLENKESLFGADWKIFNGNTYNKESLFGVDWKIFNGNIYGATTKDLLESDVIVITLDSAVKLRRLGLPVYIIWVDGEIRENRNRKVDVPEDDELMEEVDLTLKNDGMLKQAADTIKLVHSLGQIRKATISRY